VTSAAPANGSRTGLLASTRDLEYRVGFSFFLERFEHVVGLVAGDPAGTWPLPQEFPFSSIVRHTSPTNLSGKSARESDGLRHLVQLLDQGSLGHFMAEDTIVVKASGRYHIAKSTFLQEVETSIRHGECDVWGRPFGSWRLNDQGHHVIEQGDNKLFTFLYAMLWKHFRELYLTVPIEKLESYDGGKGWLGYDIESHIMDYIKERQLRLCTTNHLHVVANIDNTGHFMYL
jgi:hypothetical protein